MKGLAIFLALTALVLASCQRRPLTARTEPLYPSYLASENINTPDCRANCFFGQQIVIHWNLPAECSDGELALLLTVRYGDLSYEEFNYDLDKRWGTLLFRLINQPFWEKGGILSYKLELYREEELVEVLKHHLWADIIEIAPVDAAVD